MNLPWMELVTQKHERHLVDCIHVRCVLGLQVTDELLGEGWNIPVNLGVTQVEVSSIVCIR